MKPLIVGEVNMLSADPKFALYPYPANGSGGRLARILGLDPLVYLRMFDRMNLYSRIPVRWSIADARYRAALLAEQQIGRQVVMLLGRRVAEAFCPTSEHHSWAQIGQYYLIPHPSGRCRAWNDPTAIERTRTFLSPIMENIRH